MAYLVAIYIIGGLVNAINNGFIIISSILAQETTSATDQDAGDVDVWVIIRVCVLSVLWPGDIVYKIILMQSLSSEIERRRAIAWSRYEADQRRIAQEQFKQRRREQQRAENEGVEVDDDPE